MGCCGRNKKVVPKPNKRLCPRCGWVLNLVHKYDNRQKIVDRNYLCSNKLCGFKEEFKK